MGALDFLFVVAVILVLLWLLGFFIFNLGTIIWVLLVIAVIIILVPTAYRTQSITATKNMIAAPKAASQLFCKQRNRTCIGRLGHSPRLIIIYQYALS